MTLNNSFENAVQQLCKKWEMGENPRFSTYKLWSRDDLRAVACWASQQGYYLCTLFASDERSSEAHTFVLYYLFSGGVPCQFYILNYLVDRSTRTYPSIRQYFPSAATLEQETSLFGLSPEVEGNALPERVFHRTTFPPDLEPMVQTHYLSLLREKLGGNCQVDDRYLDGLTEGKTFPVGPIHAQIIGAGLFLFQNEGEIIEDIKVILGYQHRAIEKHFESDYFLEDGWKLAERVAGESSFAHSMAYCQAVESLAGVTISPATDFWRAFFLELERFYNHIGCVAALFHDIALDTVASRMMILQESVYQLNQKLSGNFLLRGVNIPGGVTFTGNPLTPGNTPPDLSGVPERINEISRRFIDLSLAGMNNRASRNRLRHTGILASDDAWGYATGLAARASALALTRNGEFSIRQDELLQHDFRLKHPQNAYKDPLIHSLLAKTLASEDNPTRSAVFREDLGGDTYARLALRVAEVETSTRMLIKIAQRVEEIDDGEEPLYKPVTEELGHASDYRSFGLGYVEGWGGEIIYWIIKGPDNSIFRCSLRDPAMYNWPALCLAVGRCSGNGNENILADFPVINKSFNNSYSGFSK